MSIADDYKEAERRADTNTIAHDVFNALTDLTNQAAANASSALSHLDFRVNAHQLCAGIVDFHLPVDAALAAVDVAGPGGGFPA